MTGTKHGYWIHDRRESKTSVTGYLYLPSCTCSECGRKSNTEKEKCPYCGAIMDLEAPADDDSKNA